MEKPGKCHGSGVRRPDLDSAEIRRLYVDEKMPITKIAKKFETSRVTITNRLRKAGVAARHADADEAREMYVGGHLGIAAIAKHFGVSQTTVRRTLAKIDIETNRSGIRVPVAKKRPDVTEEGVMALQEKGVCVYQIAKRLNVSRPTVERRIKAARKQTVAEQGGTGMPS